MKELLENFLETYKIQKKYLDKDNNYTMDGKNFIDWYIKESGNVVNNINYTRCCETLSDLDGKSLLVKFKVNTHTPTIIIDDV